MKNLRQTVEKISQSPGTAMVDIACREALKDGSDAAMVRALVKVREVGQYAQQIREANEALGFDE